jgi:methyl-accepting chemotaxis protein
MLGQVGAFGVGIIALEAGLFVAALIYGRQVSKSLRPILRNLSASLRDFDDKFGDEECLVTKARTRYRRSLRHIESVDARLVAESTLSESEAARVLGKRMSYSQFEHVYKSVPSTLITLGLLGTFVGLASNLGELALILDATQGSPAGALSRASSILEPMATAFLTSLVGVALSILLWLEGNIQGTHTAIEDVREMTSAYLDQVIQANSKRFSLLKESVDRMEGYLSEFLSSFSERVGLAIDKAMNEKIGQVFNSIKQSAEAYSYYVTLLDEGSQQLNQSAARFFQASKVFGSSDFATKFGEATSQFMATTDQASESLSSLIRSTQTLDQELLKTRETIEQGADLCSAMLKSGSESIREMSSASSSLESASGSVAEAAKQLREARLAVGRDARANESMTAQMSQALLEIAALSERVTALAGSIQDSMPSHYDSVNENVDQIKRSVESSLEALVSLSSARAETLRDNA